MATRLIGVQPWQLPDAFELIRPFLTEIAEATHGKVTIADLAKFIAEQKQQLWLAVDNDNDQVMAAATTEIVNHARMRVLYINGATGTDVETWLPHIEEVERYAKAMGCMEVIPIARPGWERMLRKHGYKKTHVCLEKVI